MNSSVLLVPSHHNFYTSNFLDSKDMPNEVIELTEEMLSWAYYGHNGELSGGYWVNTYHNALEALLNISPFDAQVSIWADVEEKRICLTTKREWGVIYLGDQVVVKFSHYSRPGNSPFYGLLEWTEQVDDNAIERVKKWTVNQWKDFFYGRIRKIAEDNLSSAKKKIKEAKKQQKVAEKIIVTIPV